jgi:putative ABC transport system substrate-binding protein
MNKRNTIFALLALGAASLTSVAQQPPRNARRIGWLAPGMRGTVEVREWEAFLQSLKEAGYIEGRDVVIDQRFADGRQERLPALAAELVALNPAVIVTYSTAGVAAVKNATASIPIVFASAGDPMGSGFIASYRRPGGRITGVSSAAPGGEAGLEGKMLELIKGTLPAQKRIGVILHNRDPVHKDIRTRISRAAAVLGLEESTATVGEPEELERAIGGMAVEKIHVLFIPDQVFLGVNHPRIAQLAGKFRMAMFSLASDDTGSLMSLTVDSVDILRRVGRQVGRILKGENPAEIAVDQPERFSLVVDLNAAKQLGIQVPQSIAVRADRVIE